MRGALARQRMVDAAEALMAERGIGAVSMREVQIAAGQRNKSAAQYHFSTREGLIEAILAARMVPVNEHRRELLEQLDREGRDDLRSLVEAFVEPIVAMSVARPNSSYARFLAQAYRDNLLVEIANQTGVRQAYWDWFARVERHLEHVPPELRPSRVDTATSSVINTLARWEARPDPGGLPLEARVEDLVDCCVAILAAPVSGSTRAVLRSVARRRA